jgi:hypothetical protein
MDEMVTFSARLSVIEMLLTLLLVELVKSHTGPPEMAIERLRTMFWNAGPNLSSMAPQTEKVFRHEWERRIDILFDDAARVLKASQK